MFDGIRSTPDFWVKSAILSNTELGHLVRFVIFIDPIVSDLDRNLDVFDLRIFLLDNI